MLKNINIKLCKYVLGVGKYATNVVVTGELGRYPVALKLILHSYRNRSNLLHEKSFIKNSFVDSLLIDNPNHQCNEHISSLSGGDLNQSLCSEYALNVLTSQQQKNLCIYAQFNEKFKIENYVLSNCLLNLI